MLLIMQPIFSSAQQNNNYFFHHIDQTDGLLHNQVNSIVQDSKGFIWILTPNGLQRFDGVRFVNHPYDQNNPDGMIYPLSGRLYIDKQYNWLWIDNQKMERLDLRNDKFTIYNSEELIGNPAFHFDRYTDAKNNNWLAGKYGVYRSDSMKKNWNLQSLAIPSLGSDRTNSFITDSLNNAIYMVTYWDGILWFDKTTRRVYSHKDNPLENPLLAAIDKTGLSGIMMDSEHNIWVSSGIDEFYKYCTITRKLTVYSLASIKKLEGTQSQRDAVSIVNCIYEDKQHTIWIGSSNAGLLRYNPVKDDFSYIINQEKNKQGIQYNYDIDCIFQDREDNIWLGTDKGISLFNPYRQYFHSIHHEENELRSLPRNEIDSYIETQTSDILIGTWGGGMSVYDNHWHFKRTIHFPLPYEYNMIWSFIQNDDGTTWAGCQHAYIHIYSPDGSIRTIHPPELDGFTIRCMAKDKKGNILLGLHSGKIAVWNKQVKKFLPYNDSLQGITQNFKPVTNIFFDHERCWVSTENGFKEFDIDKRIYTAIYLPDKNNPASISANRIQGIEKYDDSTLLIGTSFGGLNFFRPASKTFSHFTANDGLPSNSVYSLKKDTAGYIWMTTDYGLYKFRIKEKKIIRYNLESGIINSSFKATGFYPMQNGTWLTSTATEVISFRPGNEVKDIQKLATVEITGVKISNNSVAIDSLLAENKALQLDYKENFLTIEFAALDFWSLQQNKYYYQLAGVDKDWVNAGTRCFADYTNLEPGEYIFYVKTDNGNESSSPSSMKIIISPPFWKTAWFKILCLLLAALLVYIAMRKRIRTIRHEAGLKHTIAETEMMALRAQMNPHFIFNCLNSIDNLIQTNEKEKATFYLSRFAKLIRSILENSQHNVVPCWKDIETLKLYLEMEKLRWDEKFSCKVDISDDIFHGDYKVPPLVIQPFVENAIHHGLLNKLDANRKLWVEVFVKDNHIHYIIEDNGVGRKRANTYKQLNKPSHESVGMQITAKRINLFNQQKNGAVTITDLFDAHNEPIGTKVEVLLNIQS